MLDQDSFYLLNPELPEACDRVHPETWATGQDAQSCLDVQY